MVKTVNFMLCVFYHDKKMNYKKTQEHETYTPISLES